MEKQKPISGTIFDVKKYAVHDGPGIRLTVFFKGCPLHCRWCHNPEGIQPHPELTFQTSRCLENCTDCITVCPHQALTRTPSAISIERTRCRLSGKCVEACPTEALRIIGRRVNVKEVMDIIEKDRIFFDNSGGGVTFSGGEPLLQFEFLQALLLECRNQGLHTIVDTCGYAPFEQIAKILDKVDIFYYDLKIIDENKHLALTGVSNRIILENLQKLSAAKKKIQIRIPVIPGINDDQENIAKTAEFLKPIPGITGISLLPYHRIGRGKYQNLDLPADEPEIQTPAEATIERISTQLQKQGFKIKVGG